MSIRRTVFILIIFLWGLFFNSIQSGAGILIEPYVGYSTFDAESNWDFDGSGDYNVWDVDSKNYAYGLKLGYVTGGPLAFMFGFDYSKSTTSSLDWGINSDHFFDFDDGINTERVKGMDTSASMTNAGIFLGLEVSPIAKVWGTYYPFSHIELTENAGPEALIKGNKWKGTGYGVGVGILFVPLVSLNVEWRKFQKYDSVRPKDSYNYNLDIISADEILFTLSVPLEF